MKPITALLILDGFGADETPFGNAIVTQGIPHITALKEQYPHTTITASGMDVGLPDGQMGNSEVGHLNIGAGRIVYQEFTRVSKSIADGDFFGNPALLGAVQNCLDNGSDLHLLGLVSDGGVHSHLEHIYALLDLARQRGLERVYVHCFMDGRDVPPKSGQGYIEQLEAQMLKLGVGRIATVMGRYWAMDRDNRWERVEKAYNAMVYGEGREVSRAVDAMTRSYASDETDEFITPSIVMDGGKPVSRIGKNDSIIFFNFRPDRAREITRTFIENDFNGFVRKNGYFPVHYVTLTQYDATFTNLSVAFAPQSLDNTLGQYLAQNGLTQLRIAETEKYAHVTFFFNGGVEAPNEGEERVLIPSPKVATYDLKPEMSAYEVADEALKRIQSGAYDVMVLNFANPDMVGHTGVMDAAIDAIAAVDECVCRVVEAVLSTGGRCIITADHGNAEKMIDPDTNGPFTAHTTGRVPFILVDPARKDKSLRGDGRLADIAPTLLTMLGLRVPVDMTGKSMIE